MTQADRIRRYVLACYVGPARASGSAELTIRAGDVCRAMELHGRAPNVCSVLGSRIFFDMAGVRLLGRVGPRQSTTTTFRYAFVEPRVGAASPPTTRARPAEQGSEEIQTAVAPQPGRGGNENLTVVIACAGTKSASGRVGGWRADGRVRWHIRRFRSGPQSGSHGCVSSPRSPNPACRFPAPGSPVGSCTSYTGDEGQRQQG